MLIHPGSVIPVWRTGHQLYPQNCRHHSACCVFLHQVYDFQDLIKCNQVKQTRVDLLCMMLLRCICVTCMSGFPLHSVSGILLHGRTVCGSILFLLDVCAMMPSAPTCSTCSHVALFCFFVFFLLG